MCGIVGYLSGNHEVDEVQFQKSLMTLEHRGPDDSGIFISQDRKIALGHTRLSFLDLSAKGRQPLANVSKNLWITFNGEIYNYLELKEQLIKEGYDFHTGTDTEVILAGYQMWGVHIVEKLEGMFAFCIYDVNAKKALLVRDRFGIKPLYYSIQSNTLFFASETKAFIESGYAMREIDFTSFSDFFVYRYIPSPKSIWKGVSKLPPATYLEFDISSSESKQVEYWQPDFSNNVYSQKQLVEEIDDLLFNSINHHAIADVEIGSFFEWRIRQ